MTIQAPQAFVPPQDAPLIPPTAPFSDAQRAWLNGFFAGLLSFETPQTTPAPAEADDGAPWHDPAMPLPERMTLAENRPLPRKLFAAMAQQDCGQCGYLCESYAEKLFKGEEARQNLCVPGGKETSRMLKTLLAEAGGVAPAAVVAETPKPAAIPGYSREAPVEATFLGARRLTGETSEKDARHVEFDLDGCGLDYAPGDSFGLFAQNDPALADAVLAAMRAPADFPVGGKTLRAALIEDYSLGLAPDMLFELMGYVTGGERRRKAKLLAQGGDPDGDAATLDVLAALEKFAPVHPDPEAFLESLEPLQPRLYSISSSPAATPGKLALTVDAVRYAIGERGRLGVASTFLADRLTPGARVKVYIQKAHGFGLPADPATPIIMVGPGTGIAPFRSFLWHRKATAAPGRNWLFFGHQREHCDFFYREEIHQFAVDGVLTHLSTAWSRDGERKVYVQDKMREAGAKLWAWLGEGAHVYVCGDAKRMAKDVENALAESVAVHGGMSETAARAFVGKLKADGRYQQDVY
ncbi:MULTISPECIES: sulfite reductase subunit alpha [Rhodomicrobium]|uniref:sulfite reductase subunit alpha n=1 Tax=Rhodomicrobium TaxID=1068 RepID=UPI000B4C0F11|nr:MULTISPECIES: sulfite reductase subunit alpha [Rhodomicrobium]